MHTLGFMFDDKKTKKLLQFINEEKHLTTNNQVFTECRQ